MNVQTLCLGILSFADMTGYDIRKMASEGNFSHFCEASFGSIYPALSQLTQKNYATFTQEILPGKPSRKIYAITDEGRSYLYETLQDDPSPDRCQSEFLFHSLFADHIPPSQFRKLLVRRIAETAEKLEALTLAQEQCDHEPSLFAIGYGVTINQAKLEYLTDQLKKINSASISDSKQDPQIATETKWCQIWCQKWS